VWGVLGPGVGRKEKREKRKEKREERREKREERNCSHLPERGI